MTRLQGNHEFYGNESVEQTIDAVRQICAQRPEKLVLLHRSSLLVDGVRVLGTTLWSEGPEKDRQEVEMCLADYKR